MHFPKIRHPDWLKDSTIEKTHRHYREGIYPESISGWLLVTAHRHDLRAIYGSDFRAACALLWHCIVEKLAFHCYRVRWRVGLLTKVEREVEEDCRKMDEEFEKSKQR
jgi:hypothetical protein